MNILVLHGPNLNLLGEREPEVYGTMTLAQLNARLRAYAKKKKFRLKIFQSNSEGGLMDLMQGQRRWADGLVFNPGAFTHYSYALHDCVKACRVPTVETHLSDITKREAFRRKSVIRPACAAGRMGKGLNSYFEAIDFLLER